MNSCDERLEALLNRAGQTISDLPKGDGQHLIYDRELRKDADKAQREWHGIDPNGYIDVIDDLHMHQDYILHLTDIIDRMETALENLLNLKDRHVHIVSNVDAPEGLTQEQYFAAAEAIIEATDKYRAGLEPWDDWSVDDDADTEDSEIPE